MDATEVSTHGHAASMAISFRLAHVVRSGYDMDSDRMNL